jgi:predicted transcriptional regulator
MATSTRTSRTFTISFPPDLAEQVERLAAKESRTTSELFREAFRAYRVQRAQAAFERLRTLAEANGNEVCSEEDIERFVDEDRAEQWALKQTAKK